MLGVDQREKSTSALNEKVLMQTSSVCRCLLQWDQNYKCILGFERLRVLLKLMFLITFHICLVDPVFNC